MIKQMETRTLQAQISQVDSTEDNKLVIEGKAVLFNEKTLLFEIDDTQYYEIIDRNAFNDVDLTNVYLYFNHNGNNVIASTKNNSLQLDIRNDGIWFRAELVNTTIGRDVYELVKSGIINKCSFGFTIAKDGEEFDDKTNTFTVIKIDRLFELSLVNFPAYDNTIVYARSELKQLEDSRQATIKQERIKNLILKTYL